MPRAMPVRTSTISSGTVQARARISTLAGTTSRSAERHGDEHWDESFPVHKLHVHRDDHHDHGDVIVMGGQVASNGSSGAATYVIEVLGTCS